MNVADVLEPRGTNLLVTKEVIEEKTTIEIPDTARGSEKATTGVVVKAGPQAPAEYEPGTRVVFGRFAGNEVALEDGGSSLWILDASEVRGYFEEEL